MMANTPPLANGQVPGHVHPLMLGTAANGIARMSFLDVIYTLATAVEASHLPDHSIGGPIAATMISDLLSRLLASSGPLAHAQLQARAREVLHPQIQEQVEINQMQARIQVINDQIRQQQLRMEQMTRERAGEQAARAGTIGRMGLRGQRDRNRYLRPLFPRSDDTVDPRLIAPAQIAGNKRDKDGDIKQERI